MKAFAFQGNSISDNIKVMGKYLFSFKSVADRCNKRCIVGFLVTLLFFSSSAMTLSSGMVLCVRGSDHVALEFAHKSPHSLSFCQDSTSGSLQSISRVTTHQVTDDRCLDIPISLEISNQHVTLVQLDRCKIPSFQAFTSLSNFCADALGGAVRPRPPLFQTSTSLSLHTTVLLI